MARAQVQLADATVYHANIANSKVASFIANQKSLTDSIADAKIAVIDTTFTAIDRGLDKVTHQLGFVGDAYKRRLK
jgi:hypothetical protein